MDIELYNYIDVVLRKLKMGKLEEEINQKTNNKAASQEDVDQKAAELEANEDEDDDELKKVDGIFPIKIGPDGVPLKRNNSDVMNNFFINIACRSFTDIDKALQELANNGESRRQAKFDAYIQEQKTVWEQDMTMAFNEQGVKYSQFIKRDLSRIEETSQAEIQKMKTELEKQAAKKSSTESTHSGEAKGTRRKK